MRIWRESVILTEGHDMEPLLSSFVDHPYHPPFIICQSSSSRPSIAIRSSSSNMCHERRQDRTWRTMAAASMSVLARAPWSTIEHPSSLRRATVGLSTTPPSKTVTEYMYLRKNSSSLSRTYCDNMQQIGRQNGTTVLKWSKFRAARRNDVTDKAGKNARLRRKFEENQKEIREDDSHSRVAVKKLA